MRADQDVALKNSVHRDLSCEACHSMITPQNSSLNKKKISTACGQCHTDIAAQYAQSVHGISVAKGSLDAPTCTDCHGEHSILPHLEKLSRVYPTNIAKTTCPQCHASERIVTKYNLPTGKVESFKDTYHGMAGKIGDVKVANCASCHGVHNILPSSDTRSTIHPSNLAATCGKCHPNANENFVKGSVHGYSPTGHFVGKLFHDITWFYVILIVLVVGGYLLHNGLDYLKKVKVLYRKSLEEPFYPRMNQNERIQHGVLLVSFFILTITGFALKFGWTLPVGETVNSLLRSTLHRVAGVAMTGVLLYNIAYWTLSKRGREIMVAMLPRGSDLREARDYLWYLLGRRREKPRFGRFTYWEKMEYWSVVWGGLIMGVTGFVMWFENWSLGFLPKWGIDLATLIHYLEAILATLAILIGHLYFVIANPDVSPLSFTWLTGRISKHEALEQHPIEYEKQTPRTNS